MTVLAAGIGAVLGMAIAGGPVGLIVGGLAGAILGNFLGQGIAATSAPLASILAPAAPTTLTPINADVVEHIAVSSGEVELTELRRSFRARMKDYVKSLKSGDPKARTIARDAFAKARELYQSAKQAAVTP